MSHEGPKKARSARGNWSEMRLLAQKIRGNQRLAVRLVLLGIITVGTVALFTKLRYEGMTEEHLWICLGLVFVGLIAVIASLALLLGNQRLFDRMRTLRGARRQLVEQIVRRANPEEDDAKPKTED